MNKEGFYSMLAKLGNINNLERKIFYAAAIFLPSALPISGFLMLILIIIFFSKKTNLPKNKSINYLIILTIILMLISSIYSSINIDKFISDSQSFSPNFLNTYKFNIWIDLLNWFPLFLIYFVSQKYLKNIEDRIKFAKYIFIGTIPVIISCVLQYWFKVYGPFEFLFGSIVWFQKPISFGLGVSGLFSNQNYAGAWLSTILPFSIFLIVKNKNFIFKRIIAFIFSLLQSYFIVLTNSRNAFFGLLISLVFIFGLKGTNTMLLGLFFLILLISSYSFLNPLFFNKFINGIISNQLFTKISDFNFSDFIFFPRIEIFYITTNLISESPIWGYGSGTFSNFYLNSGGLWNAQHAHNLPLQIAYDYGILTAITITLIFILLFIETLKKIILDNKKSNLIDKCWFISFTIALIFNLTDITYYDGKISILIWILLSGLNCISNVKEEKKIYL